jgi:small subunit ribosomal protein S8
MDMAVTDPVADMLTRIRNAVAVRHDTVRIPASNMKISLAKILRDEGFLANYEVERDKSTQGTIKLYLHYGDKGQPSISGLKRVSRPGLRIYVGKGEIPRYYGGLGVAIISTSNGMMTGKQAWRKGVGGELLCYIW